MRGRPVIHWVLFLAAWACLAIPIALVTRGGKTARTTQVTDSASVMTWISLRFSAEPSHFELLQHDKVLWRESPAEGTEFENSFPVSIDEFGAELILRSSLPGTSAIEITVEPDERPERSQTLWLDGDVNETLTFSWSRNV